MHIKRKVLILLCCIISLFTNTAAHSKKVETITWLIWELSPEFIRYGKYAGQGFADRYLHQLIKLLPEYDHKIQWTGIKRFHVESIKPNRCTPHIWKAFHLDKFVYSKPYMLTPPHVAIFHKRFEKTLGPDGSIQSIEDLIGKKKLKLITPSLSLDQPRYPVLNPYLQQYAGSSQIIEMKDGSNEIDLRLLERGRADFAIGYATTVTAQRRDRDLIGEFVTYGLKEHQQYKGIHVACLGNELGKTVIKKINTLFNEERLKVFLGFYEEWNNGDENFRRAYVEQILSKETDY